MKKLTFGIDIDGVLRDFLGGCLDIYRSEKGVIKDRESCTSYDLEDSFPDIPNATEYFLNGWRRDKILLGARTMPNAVDSFNILSEIGHTIIITHQVSFENQKLTLQWLHKNGFNFDDICFIKDKWHIGGLDFFLDDSPYKFKQCTAETGVMIDAPYNRNVELSKLSSENKCIRMMRCESLYDFTVRLTNGQISKLNFK